MVNAKKTERQRVRMVLRLSDGSWRIWQVSMAELKPQQAGVTVAAGSAHRHSALAQAGIKGDGGNGCQRGGHGASFLGCLGVLLEFFVNQAPERWR